MPTGFFVNSFSVKLRRLKQKVTEKGEGKRVRMPSLPEFVPTADSEASDVKSSHFEGDTGAEIPPDALGGVGTAPMEDIEVEEVKEDPDVHFKRKQQGGSRRKRVVKKPHRYTLTIIAEANQLQCLLLLPR